MQIIVYGMDGLWYGDKVNDDNEYVLPDDLCAHPVDLYFGLSPVLCLS